MQDYHKTAGAPLGKISWVTTILNSIHRKAWASETSVKFEKRENWKKELGRGGSMTEVGGGGGGAGASRKFNLKEYLSFYIWSGTGRSWLILVGIGKGKIIFIRGKGAHHVMVGTVTRNPTIGVGMVDEKKSVVTRRKKKYFTFFTMTTQQIQN